ncbi:MAG: DUF5658 family protein [Candidatus Nanohaloarchaea archaeon]
MEGLNKKLSGKTRLKTEQLKEKSLTYLTALALIAASTAQVLSSGPFTEVAAVLIIFYIGASAEAFQKKVFYVLSIALTLIVFQAPVAAAIVVLTALLLLSYRNLSSDRIKLLYLFLSGVVFHLGDFLTTLKGLEIGLAEQNPVLVEASSFTGLWFALFSSKLLLFAAVLFLYYRRVENLELMLEAFMLSGFYLVVSNLNAIL